MMSKDTEITRVIQIDEKTVTVHIHLTEDEVRRLLLPHVVEAFGQELRQRTHIPRPTYSSSTTDAWWGQHQKKQDSHE